MTDRPFKSKKALTRELMLRSHQMKPCTSYSPCTQISNLQSAPRSLILHHSSTHSRCSVKFSARSVHSQAPRGKSTLAFGWLRAIMSSALPSFNPWWQPPKPCKQRALSQQVEREPSCSCITRSVSKKMQVENYTFNINFELTTSKGKQLQTTTSLLYSLGGRGCVWKKTQTLFAPLLVKKNAKSTTGSFLQNS